MRYNFRLTNGSWLPERLTKKKFLLRVHIYKNVGPKKIVTSFLAHQLIMTSGQKFCLSDKSASGERAIDELRQICDRNFFMPPAKKNSNEKDKLFYF